MRFLYRAMSAAVAVISLNAVVLTAGTTARAAPRPAGHARAATIAQSALAATLMPQSTSRPGVTHKSVVSDANGLDRAQLAELARTGKRPANTPVLKAPSAGLGKWATATLKVGKVKTNAAAAGIVYPGMTVTPGTPQVVVDSATYQGGNFPADVYQYMTAADCQAQIPTGGVYTKNRYSTCRVQQYLFTLYNCDADGTNCVKVGDVTWRATVVGSGNDGDVTNFDGGAANGSRMVKFQFTIDEVTTSGDGPSASMSPGMTCTAISSYICAGGGSGPTKTFAQWSAAGANTADFSFTSPINNGAGPDMLVVATAAFTATESWAGSPSVQAPTPYPLTSFRFDSAGRAAWGAKFQGRLDAAVFAILPVLKYDGGCGSAACNQITQTAGHIQLAYNLPASTMPPWTGGGPKPAIPGGTRNDTDWLSRTTDDTRIALNDAVTTTVCNRVLPTVPAGSNCDEFPFKTTYQGGASGGPYSLLRIDGNDNQEAGRRLGPFYTLQRIVDCNPLSGPPGCDAFGVIAAGPTMPAPYAFVVVDEVPGGTFADEWDLMGDAAGVLGTPSGPENATMGGQEQDFSGGNIYWSANTGTHEVHGSILADYRDLGGTTNPALGFPLSDQQSTPDGGAQENLFAGSTCGSASGSAIIVSSSTPPSEMQGCIYQAYLNTYNGPGGNLGYPESNEQSIGSGKVNYMSGTSCNGASGSAIYWNGVAHAVTDCIFRQYKSMGEATGSLGFPTGEEFAIPGGVEQIFQHGYITSVNGTTTAQPWLVGHAAHAGNDYPYETLGQFNNTQDGTDAWNEFYGQCDSFAAWKVYENLAGPAAQHPGSVPAPGWTPSNASVSPVNQFTWGPDGGKYGNADVWAAKFAALGYTVDTVPTPGAIAYWPNAVTDPQDGNPPNAASGIGEFGHVAFVSDVYPDGSITIEQYNMRENGEYSVAHMPFGQGYTDTSFSQGSFSVPWPEYFIHVADGPSGGASPSEPGNGVVQASNPSQVLVIGPGSPASQFTTGNVWYNDPGHGETGQEIYTHTNGPTAVSTATWTAPVTASACYRVDALVPDQYSDNPTAIYTVTDEIGTHTAAVNENDYTSDWAELGVYQASNVGQITVRLDDRGNTGLYVAADAMRFWPQSCGGYGDAAPVTMATSASGTWSVRSGHGFFGTEQYATTSGSVTTESKWADYSIGVLPSTCYEISAYVPDNYSDAPAARYQVQDAHYGTFYPQVDENSFTNQFASLGIFKSTASGTLWVELGNEAPSGLYVAADALAFVVDPGCAGLPGRPAPAGATLVGLNDNSAWFSTTGDWNSGIGHGFYNHDLWIPTTTSGTASSTATWNAFLNPDACYNVSAWIPNNYYADNTQASYQVMVWNGGNGAGGPFGTVNQNDIGDAWAPIGQVTTQTGEVSVTLGNTGNSGSYTAADELAFSPC